MNRRRLAILIAIGAILLAVSLTPTFAAAIRMSTGFYYPTERTWTGDNGNGSGDPKQPWNDGSPGGRIYGYLDPAAPKNLSDGKQHVGMDIRAPYNGPVYAVTSGTIYRYMNTGDSRYWCIIVKHQLANGTTFYGVYGHCRLKSGYSTGKALAPGENFAQINESGNQHIHFGLKMDSNFGTGWGHLSVGTNANSIGWRGPNTFMKSNTASGGSNPPPDDDGGGTNPPPPTPTDRTAPTITLTSPTASVELNTVQTIGWNVTDSGTGVESVTLQWDSNTPSTVSTSGSAQVPSDAQYVTVAASDKAGNKATKRAGPFQISSMVVTTDCDIFADGYYVQTVDCSEGIRIQYGPDGGPDVIEGNTVLVTSAEKKTVNGEQVMTNATVVTMETVTPIEPVEVSVRDLDTEAIDVGVLVTVTGTVSWIKNTGEAFYIDDGSGINDGYHTGVRIVCDGFADGSKLPMPEIGQTVTVVGISAIARVVRSNVPSIRPRYVEDIVIQALSEDPNPDTDQRRRRDVTAP